MRSGPYLILTLFWYIALAVFVSGARVLDFSDATPTVRYLPDLLLTFTCAGREKAGISDAK